MREAKVILSKLSGTLAVMMELPSPPEESHLSSPNPQYLHLQPVHTLNKNCLLTLETNKLYFLIKYLPDNTKAYIMKNNDKNLTEQLGGVLKTLKNNFFQWVFFSVPISSPFKALINK